MRRLRVKDSVYFGFNEVNQLAEVKDVLGRVAHKLGINGPCLEIVLAPLPAVEDRLELSLQGVDAVGDFMLAKDII